MEISPRTGEKHSITHLLFMAVAVLLLALAIFAQWRLADSGDRPFLLTIARMWLGGKQLYHDMFQPNFPMITWYDAAGISLAQLTGLTAAHGVTLLTCAAIAVSLLICNRLLSEHPCFKDKVRLLKLHNLTLLSLFMFFVSPLFFGDRDHLLLVLLFPYFLRSMPSLARQDYPIALRLIIAALAAAAMFFKPHALLLLGGIILLRFLRERRLTMFFTAEMGVILLLLALYLLWIICFMPDYFGLVVPMLRATYFAINSGIGAIQYYVGPLFTLAVIFSDFRPRYRSPYRSDIYYLLAFCPFALGYVLVNNGWVYTFYPLSCTVLLLAVWLWLEFRWLKDHYAEQGLDTKPFRFGATACALAFSVNLFASLLTFIGLLSLTTHEELAPREKLNIALSHLLRDSHARSFADISATAADWPVLSENTGLLMETRFHHLFMLMPFMSMGEDFKQRNAWIPAFTAHAYAEDLTRNKPDIVLVDATDNFAGTGKKFDIIAYFSTFPAFAEAWKSYHLLKTVDVCDEPDVVKQTNREVWCRHLIYRRTEKTE